ncbi:hypothetical protein BDL97_04G131800 [Sphagnum fallax]|nr:hypothetical protein BDL97_04G131800 [Sphagnum fallax]
MCCHQKWLLLLLLLLLLSLLHPAGLIGSGFLSRTDSGHRPLSGVPCTWWIPATGYGIHKLSATRPTSCRRFYYPCFGWWWWKSLLWWLERQTQNSESSSEVTVRPD